MAINFERVNVRNLSGRQKVAALMISLGPEVSSELMRGFSEREIEMVTLEMLRMQRVPSRVLEAIQGEFRELLLGDESLSIGGPDYAREVLMKAIGEDRTQEVLDRVMAGSGQTPFDFFRVAEPTQLFNFIQNEHPQTVALILSHLKAAQAAVILQSLGPDLQADVAKRVATMDSPSPDVIRQVESALRERMASVIVEDVNSDVGGLDYLVKVLTQDGYDGRMGLVVNHVPNRQEARFTYERVAKVARQFLGARLLDAGFILADAKVPECVRRREPFVLAYPRCPASRCLAALAAKLASGDALVNRKEGFFRRVVNWFV